MAELFTRFTANYCLNIARTARRQLEGRHLLYLRPEQPFISQYKLPDKDALTSINGGKRVLACF